jgi:hypothetical protein
VMINTSASEGIYTLIFSLVFVSLSATEVHSRAANAGESIKEADSVVPWMDRRPTVAA